MKETRTSMARQFAVCAASVDLDKDGKPEIITSTKRGTFIFWNQWPRASR
jgi:hypothetical protein